MTWVKESAHVNFLRCFWTVKKLSQRGETIPERRRKKRRDASTAAPAGQALLGVDMHTHEQIFIKKATRRQGLLIAGASGSGKSNLLENLIVTDIVQGNFGVCLFDPHGDLLRNVIARIPRRRIENGDVLVLDCIGIEHVHDFKPSMCRTLDLREVMDRGKVLLVRIDPYHKEAAALICTLLLRAAYGRADAEKRRQFHVYADDFDLYATEDFAELIKETRKYGIACTLATQTIAQMSGAMRAALSQIPNMIAFQLSTEDANLLADKYLASPTRKYQELGLSTAQKFLDDFIDKLCRKIARGNPATLAPRTRMQNAYRRSKLKSLLDRWFTLGKRNIIIAELANFANYHAKVRLVVDEQVVIYSIKTLKSIIGAL